MMSRLMTLSTLMLSTSSLFASDVKVFTSPMFPDQHDIRIIANNTSSDLGYRCQLGIQAEVLESEFLVSEIEINEVVTVKAGSRAIVVAGRDALIQEAQDLFLVEPKFGKSKVIRQQCSILDRNACDERDGTHWCHGELSLEQGQVCIDSNLVKENLFTEVGFCYFTVFGYVDIFGYVNVGDRTMPVTEFQQEAICVDLSPTWDKNNGYKVRLSCDI